MAFLAPLAFGAAGAGGAAATAGLFGAGGTFALGQTLATVGTGLGALGAVRQGQAAQQAANYNIAATQAEGASREAVQRRQSEMMLGRTRAAIGKSGATTAGTPLMVLAESAANAEIDALNTRYGVTNQTNVLRASGTSSRRAANVQAGTSLLTGASRIF